MRLGVAAVAICLSVVGLCAAQNAAAAMNRKPTNIPAQPLSTALEVLAKERGLQVIYRSDLVQSIQSAGAVGVFTPAEALAKLLAGTALTYRYLNESTVTITPASTAGESGAAPSQPPTSEASPKEVAKSLPFLLAQAAQGQTQGAASVGSQQKQEASSEIPLQEVIVTAEKRSERLQDVPIPVTVLAGGDLVASNELRVQDFATSVPGLSVIASGSSTWFQVVSIRGITTGTSTNPTVGFTIDDVPYGSDFGLGWAGMIPDIDPGDLARVEVLKGPQGTLYGASSMGGLIKFVTIDPSTSGFSGRIQAGVDDVSNAAEAGYNFRGAVNVPVSDDFAIRASAFTREDPGYIDNITTNTNGVGDQRVSGGRVAGLWLPSDDVSLRVSALYQDFGSNGLAEATPGLGELQQDFHAGATGQSNGTIQAYSATLAVKLGNVNLTSIAGYNVRTVHIVLDESPDFGSLTLPLYGVSGAGLVDKNETDRFTEETRFSGEFGHRVDWLIGGFYTNELSRTSQQIPALAPSGATVALGYNQDYPTTYIEYAVFGDLTFHITDRFDVQGGLRQSKIDQSISTTTYDPLFTGGVTTTTVSPTQTTNSHPLTYLATPRYKVSDDFMVYARFASGYRAGGTNDSPLCTEFNFRCSYASDKTQDYEIGMKGDTLDHKLTFDTSAYYIDWSDVQLNALSPQDITFISNAGHAKSQGIELTLQGKPWTGMTMGAEATYDDAVLTQGFAKDITLYGAEGARLPYTSRFTGNVSIEQGFPINSNVTGTAGADVAYVGDRLGNFQASASTPRQNLPGYVRTDLHVGARYNTWNLNFYANNVFDKRALIDGPGDTFPVGYIYIQPRTIGLNIAKTF
jgi:iron complex outermembrane recepter protein